MYILEFNEQSRVLTQRASGFWNLEEFGRYQAEFTALLTRLRLDGRPISMLFDSRDMPPQSAEVVNAFSRMTSADGMNPDGRIAILVSGMLSKLQAQRIADNRLVRNFNDEAEARTWLAEPI